jgi:hypothetical protein
VGRDINKGIYFRRIFDKPTNLGGGDGKQVPVTVGGANNVPIQ